MPHHLLDVLDVSETATVAAYQRDARAAVEALLAAGRTPVLVGGSRLYVQSVLDELEFPGTDPALRAELEAELAAHGPAAAARPARRRRPGGRGVVLPGERPAHRAGAGGRRADRAAVRGVAARAAAVPRYDAVLLGVDRATDDLDARVARRVARMFADGLVDEVRALLPAGLRDGLTASRALGYPQVLAALDDGST